MFFEPNRVLRVRLDRAPPAPTSSAQRDCLRRTGGNMCTNRLRSSVAIIVLSACSSENAADEDVLVRTDPASAAECAHGGSVLSSGLDENRNQTLDDVEIRTRTVVCNDAPAPPIVVRLVA